MADLQEQHPEYHIPRPRNVKLFVTCLVDQFRPQVAQSTLDILEHLGMKVDVVQTQTCCGQPAFNSGYRRDAQVIASKWLDEFDGDDPIVSTSGSCGAMIRKYFADLFVDNVQKLEQCRRFAAKTYEFSEFLVNGLGISELNGTFNHSITYHKCCHSLRELGIDQQPLVLLSSLEGIKIIPLERSEVCCGFGGTFAVNMSKLSTAMLQEKITYILETGTNFLVAGDTGCIMHLEGGIKRLGYDINVLHTAEILDEAIRNKRNIF